VRVLAIHTSPPLLDVLEVVNKRSNNFMAEQVLRTVGRVVVGDGSVEGGTTALRLFALQEVGLDSLQLRVYDGSGLSPLNRTTPAALVRLLGYAARATLWEPFWSTLPQTGARDGLRRMIGTPAEGRVWAKTGTINQVSALSGYVRSASGEMVVFSILNNRAAPTSRAKRLEDQIVARLARWDRNQSAIGQGDSPAGAVDPSGRAR
jgi:D-alanyl-D-alanine carboxypeptidase/D-alanyl-D-alanine-endopeptidase (penicillin-binding protein 4)